MATGIRIGVALAIAAGLGGCVTVPAYDARTDDMLTHLQADTDTLIAHLSDTYDTTAVAGKPCAYSANAAAFSGLRVSLGLITTRANALYDNRATVAALDHLVLTYQDLERAHQHAEANEPSHCLPPPLLVAEQRAMDSAVGALLKLELAKKGGL
jgi:hypothetical protein